MRFYSVLLGLMAAILTTSDSLVAATTSTQNKTISPSVHHSDHFVITNNNGGKERRYLRGLRAILTDDDAFTEVNDSTMDSISIEERGIGLPSFVPKLGKEVKVRVWLKTGFSDDYVKKVLELQGLTGNALTNHKSYKYFQKCSYKKEGFLPNKGYVNHLSTYGTRMKLGLDKTTVAQLKLTKEFKIYERYIKEFDDFVISKPNAGFKPKYNQVSRDVSAAEMTAKEELWAAT